jgi:cupredoxin-like protein
MTTRTAAMTVFAIAYWVLVLAVLYVIVVAFIPALRTNSAEVLPVLVLVGGFLIVFALSALVATRMPSIARRAWLWPVLAIPAVVFVLLNAPYLVYPISHPADSEFAPSLVMVVATFALGVSGSLAFRDLRDPARATGSRTKFAAALGGAITAGAVLTGFVAGAVGGGASQLVAPPTTTATLVAEGTKFVTTTYAMSSSDVLGLFIENRDSTTHSFDIDSLNIHVQLPANGTIAVAIKPAQAGALEFYCAIGGHKAAGMDGTINIS